MAGCSDCTSKQTYCMTNQKASHWVTTSFSNTELIKADTWNTIKNILQNIYNLGANGTRNPPQDSINNISNSNQNDLILLTLYNSIINSLKTGNDNINNNNGQIIEPYTLISQSLINNLQTYLNNYKLNTDRCAGCNTSCNTCNACYGVCYGCDGDCWNCYQGCGDCSQGCEETCAMCTTGGQCIGWQ